MDLSFREKSLWLMLFSLVGVFGFYFVTVLPTDAEDVMPHQVVVFSLAVVMLVVAQVVGHALIAAAGRRTETDERDRLNE